MSRFALLRRIPARLVGMGVRPEHVRTPAISTTDHVNLSAKSSGLSSIGMPCGVRSAAWSQASR